MATRPNSRSIPELATRSRAELANFQLEEDGAYLCWPTLDVHLGWEQLEQAVNPSSAQEAQ